mgnify:CR=1 FL=1
MKRLKPNTYESKKMAPGNNGVGVHIPNPEKYTGKVVKGELNDKNSRSSL